MATSVDHVESALSYGRQFDLSKGKTNGFDYLRFLLAIGVLLWHSFGIQNGRAWLDTALLTHPILQLAVTLILPMFFALSGFLVTSSLARTKSIKTYLIFRALRIGPALAVEVTLAAILLGALVTALPLNEYFLSSGVYTYFLNIVGLVHYELPGVFHENVYPRVVNGSLWTVPYELECYVYLVVLYLLGVFRRPIFLLLAFIVCTYIVVELGFTSTRGLITALKEMVMGGMDPNANLQQAAGAKIEGARILVLSFLAGSLVYEWRDKIRFHWLTALISGAVGLWMLASPALYFYSPLPLALLTVYLGLCNPPKIGILQRGDYSYGIYLYAFPIQQTIAWTGLIEGKPFLHAALSLLLVSVFAVFSWHVIEKPFLSLKKRFR